MVKEVLALIQKKSDLLACGFFADMSSEIDYLEADAHVISPVEQMFLVEWRWREIRDPTIKEDLDLWPQYRSLETTGDFRIDFKIDVFGPLVMDHGCEGCCGKEPGVAGAVSFPMIGVEIDGHLWHEKTPEQVQKDKARERFLVAKGWKLFRFSGREVYHHVDECVEEVLDFARPLCHRIRKEIHKYIKGGLNG